MINEKIIGIVGGVGPYAGLDLVRKIFDQTEARTDQDHLPVALISMPGQIGDRTGFILGKSASNPAWGIIDVLKRLHALGASVAAIACNSAHAPQIFNVIADEIQRSGIKMKLLHIVAEVARFLREEYPAFKRIGILGTVGTYRTGIYESALEKEGFEVVFPDDPFKQKVHSAIYDHEYGVKACSNPVTERAKAEFTEVISHLRDKQAGLVVLGCTEIPLAIAEYEINNIAIIDPTLIFARALIREVEPGKLKPMPSFKKIITNGDCSF